MTLEQQLADSRLLACQLNEGSACRYLLYSFGSESLRKTSVRSRPVCAGIELNGMKTVGSQRLLNGMEFGYRVYRLSRRYAKSVNRSMRKSRGTP